jgi:polysaccharide biosynthesis transport protein
LSQETADLNQTLNKLRQIAVRRRWWILLSSCGVALAVIFVSLLLPNQYHSQATILVEQQQVPEHYVVPTTNSTLGDMLQAMNQDILSRPRLLQIVDEYSLFAKQRKHLDAEQLFALIRRNIEIEALEKKSDRKGMDAFKISFTGDNPRVVQQVTRRLTALFIEENLKTREQQATETTSFLKEQLDTAQADLDRHQQALRDFKMRYLGELPEQQAGNLEVLSGLHNQLQNTMGELSRAQEQRTYLQSMLAQSRSLAVASGVAPGAVVLSPIEMAQAELTRLRNEKATLLAHYSPQYPDVLKINKEIAKAEALYEQLIKAAKEQEAQQSNQSAPTVPISDGNAAIAQLNSQLKANELEIANLTADKEQLKTQIAEYERRLNLTPVREQQLADLLRDNDLAKQNYADLLNKKTQSELATSLERHEKGQRFLVVDPPSLPVKPSSPNRLQISLMGLGAGLVLAAGLAYLAETRDCSIHTERDAAQYFKLALLIGVPLVLTPVEKWKRSRSRALQWSLGSLLVLLVFVAEFYVYWRG